MADSMSPCESPNAGGLSLQLMRRVIGVGPIPSTSSEEDGNNESGGVNQPTVHFSDELKSFYRTFMKGYIYNCKYELTQTLRIDCNPEQKLLKDLAIPFALLKAPIISYEVFLYQKTKLEIDIIKKRRLLESLKAKEVELEEESREIEKMKALINERTNEVLKTLNHRKEVLKNFDEKEVDHSIFLVKEELKQAKAKLAQKMARRSAPVPTKAAIDALIKKFNDTLQRKRLTDEKLKAYHDLPPHRFSAELLMQEKKKELAALVKLVYPDQE